MNLVVISGNLVRDPEMRYTPNGKAVTEFTVAVNQGVGEKRTTDFIRCTAWEKTAEFVAERGRKGHRVTVEGRLSTDSWTDKETGKKRETLKVTASSVSISAIDHEAVGEAVKARDAQRQAPVQKRVDDDFDDLPF